MQIKDSQKLGTGLLLLGCVFLFLGVVLLFDRGLLALGNILFLAGFAFLSGPRSMFGFFFRVEVWRGSLCFLGGVTMVLFGWVITGMCLEVWGFLNLFGKFFPIAVSFLKNIPFIGPCLSLPVVSQIVDALAGAQGNCAARPPV